MCSWDTRQMFFGAGTKLLVEPQSQPPAKPSVFIMRNGTTVACLVKDFYPKDINIKLESTKKLEEFDPAIVVSPSGKYSAVKLGRYEDPNSVTCSVEHNSEVVSSTNFEPRTNSSGTVKPKPTENENIKLTPKSISEPKATVHHSSQFTAGNVNMLSLTVLGLRMVFAKSLAINFLLTAKLFFF
uniref:Immunoglobulin C1-set domain-containing protein n=2 Tax=Felis catus TaxID=9685 RepID=A0ABI7YXK3_FELCA